MTRHAAAISEQPSDVSVKISGMTKRDPPVWKDRERWVKQFTTREWREATRKEIEARGRGFQSKMAAALGIDPGQITDTLKETDSSSRYSLYKDAIDSYLASSADQPEAPVVSRDAAEVAYLLAGLARTDIELLRELKRVADVDERDRRALIELLRSVIPPGRG